MSIVIDDFQMERLAQQMAIAQGITVEEVIREGLLSLARLKSVSGRQRPLRERLAALAMEVDALPPLETPTLRTEDEILGYDEKGLW